MYTTPNTDTLQGRQLAGLLESSNRNARMLLTVDIRKASGGTYHQTYRAKAWDARDGARMVTLDLGDGDWAAGTYATKVLHVNTATSELRPARGMQDKALLYAGEAALRWAFTGQAPQPSNGTVEVTAAQLCGCCGHELTHPVSKDLGIGPECAKRMGLEHHYRGQTLTGRAARQAKPASAAEAMAQATAARTGATVAAPAPATAPVADASQDRAEQAEADALNAASITAPCSACSGTSKLHGYTCGYCNSEGKRVYTVAGLAAEDAALLHGLANTANTLVGRMQHSSNEHVYVQYADQLDSCMAAFTKALREARAKQAVAAA